MTTIFTTTAAAAAATTKPVLFTQIPSPIGALLLVSDGEALTGVYMEAHTYGPTVHPSWTRAERWFRPAREQLDAYFNGSLTRFDLPLAPRGTAFQQAVWEILRSIPYGTTVSYAEVARRLGRPDAVRAVGSANGRNPISIIVPCHRVVGSGGLLVGYAGGLDRKRKLLELEARRIATE
ncbi:MAG TPA: methylated-DNA--[protein]-cysteine S-methyltransferase [Polyangiaceae bacterium]|jgi:methylated-DNA-[protein]-cysteine S-methyltransferase|nr:methylated-DNA--[protein]-cysteine S-methyltransferase [Polyangiaceae bacterium]